MTLTRPTPIPRSLRLRPWWRNVTLDDIWTSTQVVGECESRGAGRQVPSGLLVVLLVVLAAVPAITPFVPRESHLPALLVLQVVTTLLLPGWLFSRAIGLPVVRASHRLVFAAALSVVLLMLVGLAANVVLPALGISRPLAPSRLGPALAVVNYAALLAMFASRRLPAVGIRISPPSPGRFALYAAPVAIIAGAVFGATRLNNHGSNAIAMATMIAVAAYLAVILLTPRLPPAIFPYSLGLIALGLLLQLSLRGNVISGHDVLFEFRVFQETERDYRWSAGNTPTAYNACLSITILPVYIHDLVWVSDQAVFRVIAQLLFSLMPVIVFLGARRYVSDRLAYAAGLFFIAQSPFLGDFPFLVRQEVALVMFGTLVLVLLSSDPARKRSIAVACLLGLGLVLSHYSTTYVALGILGVGLLCQLTVRLAKAVVRRARTGAARHRSGAARPTAPARLVDTPRSPLLARSQLALLFAFIVVAAVLWTSTVTHSSSNVQQFLQDLTPPRPPSLSLLVAGHANPPPTAAYLRSITHPMQTAPGSHYPTALLASFQRGNVPVASVPRRLPQVLANAIFAAGAVVRDLIKVLVFVGVFFLVAFRKRLGLSGQHAALLCGSVVVLLASLIVPAVSVQYDPSRVYQQTLILLGLPAVIGVVVLARALRIKHASVAAAIAVFAAYLAVSPVEPQIVGSGYANMQLNNYGPYYAVYYVHGEELRAIQWLDQYGARTTPIYADWYATRKITAFSPRQIWVISNVDPVNIVQASYVFADDTNTRDGFAYADYNGTMVSYPFPSRLSAVKDVLFSAGDVRIFR